MQNGIAHNGLILLWRMREGKHLCPGKTTLSDHAVLYLPVSTFVGITVTRNSPTGQAMTTDAEAAVSEALRDLAFWLYRQLENEYDWLTSDAAVDEALLINEYTFTEAGLRAGCPVIVKLSFTDFL